MPKLVYIIVILVWSVGVGLAQPPGGGDRPGGGRADDVNVNPDVPDIDDLDLQSEGGIDIDVENAGLFDNTSSENPMSEIIDSERLPFNSDAFSEMMDNYEIPDNWSDMQLTDEMPTKDEILAMKDDLPKDIDLDSLDILPESDPEATNAIVGYASSMLGLNVTPLYAGEYGDSEVADSEVAQTTINEVYSQLDGDMQALLTQADSLSGVTYWAMLEDGLALIYTGDCDLDQCTIEQNMVQVEITSGSAGAYALYSDTVPSSSADALALVQRTYPYLATIELSETESSAGTAFFAFDIDMDSGDVVAYYAGVYGADSGQSIVYAVSGIGDAYINMMLGG